MSLRAAASSPLTPRPRALPQQAPRPAPDRSCGSRSSDGSSSSSHRSRDADPHDARLCRFLVGLSASRTSVTSVGASIGPNRWSRSCGGLIVNGSPGTAVPLAAPQQHDVDSASPAASKSPPAQHAATRSCFRFQIRRGCPKRGVEIDRRRSALAVAVGRLLGGQEQAHQIADDRDHDQQLDQREPRRRSAGTARTTATLAARTLPRRFTVSPPVGRERRLATASGA